MAAATYNVSQYAHGIATDYTVISCNCGGIRPNIATDLHISSNYTLIHVIATDYG